MDSLCAISRRAAGPQEPCPSGSLPEHRQYDRCFSDNGIMGLCARPGGAVVRRCLKACQHWHQGLAFKPSMHHPFLFLVLCITVVFRIAESCSSRSTPRPRPPPPTQRPNITFQTYECPEAYATWYCLNGATCFSVRIEEAIQYSCECAEGFVGDRCQFKDLAGSYLPSRERVIEKASIAGGLLVCVLILVIVILVCMHCKQRKKEKIMRPEDLPDGIEHPFKPFSKKPVTRLAKQFTSSDPELGHGEQVENEFSYPSRNQ